MLYEGKAPILWGFANPKALAKTGNKFRFRIAANYQDIIILCAVKMTPKETGALRRQSDDSVGK